MIFLKPIFLLTLIFLMSCTPTPQQPQVAPAPTGNAANGTSRTRTTDREYEREREREREDREEAIRESNRRDTGDTCDELLKDDRRHDCKKLCEDIYDGGAVRDCKDLKFAQIERLDELDEILENPDESDLANIDPDDLKIYMKIDRGAFDDWIKRYSKSEARDVLLWLLKGEVENDDDENPKTVTDIFKREDDEFITFELLLEKAYPAGNTGTKMHEYFTKITLDGDKLMEYVINTHGSDDEDDPNEAMDLVMDFINEKHDVTEGTVAEKADDCSTDTLKKGCFQVYCRIGKALGSSVSESWLEFIHFSRYIDDIIDCFNEEDGECSSFAPSGWAREGERGYIEDIGRLDEEWASRRGLCGEVLP